jgi:hypothetical protein
LSVVRTCDGKVIKVADCIIKVAIIRGNITWRFFALRDLAYKQKAHGNICFPLRRAYLLLLCIYFLATVKVFFPIPFYFLFLQASCGEERSRHIYPVGYEWAWVIIVDITLEVNTLGGETISPYLSVCPVETFCSWVCCEC